MVRVITEATLIEVNLVDNPLPGFGFKVVKMVEVPQLIDPDGGPDEEDPEFHPDESADAPPWGEEGDDGEDEG